MKIRHGFVSNSSSSSFIVVGNTEYTIPKANEAYGYFEDDTLRVPQDFEGETEFGWDITEWDTFADRLNWAALGAWYKEGQPGYIDKYYEELKPSTCWTEMLVDVLKEDFGVKHVKFNIRQNDRGECDGEKSNFIYGYIDHQSAPHERPDNFRFFESKEELRKWLYCKDSVIKGGNDNWSPEDGYGNNE